MRKNKIATAMLLLTVVTALLYSCKKDNPQNDLVQFATLNSAISEAATADANVVVQIATPQQSQPLIVTYEIGGTAVQGTHYSITGGGTLTIPANTSTANIVLRTIDNLQQDGSKTITFTIKKAETGGKQLSLGTLNLKHTLTITDDECSPYIRATWRYRARYFSVIPSGAEIPANQAGGALAAGADPWFTGTVSITDPANNRTYSLSDLMVGQFAGFGIATSGRLLDNCGTLTSATPAPLFFGVYPIRILNSRIVNADSISLNWSVYSDNTQTALVFRGEGGFKRQ